MRGDDGQQGYHGHVLTENRNGSVVDARLTQADGYAERRAALEMLADLPEGSRITLAAAYNLIRMRNRCAA